MCLNPDNEVFRYKNLKDKLKSENPGISNKKLQKLLRKEKTWRRIIGINSTIISKEYERDKLQETFDNMNDE